jgi:hypothetical protein
MTIASTRSCTTNRRWPGVADRAAALPRQVIATFIVAIGCIVPAVGEAQSDNDRIRELERKLEQSLKTIDELAARVKELEARSGARPEAAPTAAPAAPAAAPAAMSAAEDHDHARRAAPDLGSAIGLPPTVLKGFADVGIGYTSGSYSANGIRDFGIGGNRGFLVGSLDFYLTPRLSENVKSVIELVFEHDITTGGSLAADLERMQVGYTFSDEATLWLGRFHTPVGYWNTAFHHGSQLQTSVLRPRIIDFEDQGGVVPAHTVGIWGTGAFRMGEDKLTYDLIAGNSPSITETVLDPNNLGSDNFKWSAGFNFGYLFGGNAEGLKVGVHGYHAEVRDDAVPANSTRVNILGAYAATEGDLWELEAEYYRFFNQDLAVTTGNYNSWAGFVQVGRHYGRWTPYVRLEQAVLNQSDNYFAMLAGGRSYSLQALGLRYELTATSALKFEADHVNNRTTPPSSSFNRLIMQWAIRF